MRNREGVVGNLAWGWRSNLFKLSELMADFRDGRDLTAIGESSGADCGGGEARGPWGGGD